MALAFTELSEEALRYHENLPSPTQRLGQPRLVPLNATLYNFYEPLVLFEILQRSLGCPNLSHFSEIDNNERPSPWRLFLNQLSWLCDYKNGGDTSSAIAVEDTVNGQIYWLAANFDKKRRGPSCLSLVLQKLSDLNIPHAGTHTTILGEILQTCLQFSSEKFENYRRLLLHNINFATISLAGSPDSLEARLLLDLEHVSEQLDPSELSSFAFEYVKSDTVREIHAKHRDRAPREAGSAWYNICHYIGRLGAWARAVKVVVHFVRNNPQVVENFHVNFIAAPEPIAPPPADHQTNLEHVVKRLFPNDEHWAEMMTTQLRSAMAPGFDLDKEFTRKYESKSFSPRSHAELLLLEHFSTRKLSFFFSDKYVGSSKPSCYCCNLYFKFHKGAYETRQTHGNAWHKWCLPPELMQEDKMRLEWDGKAILKLMTEQIRSDILGLVSSSLPLRARMQDSTTGWWTAPTSGLRFI